jgi:hypothetical protein
VFLASGRARSITVDIISIDGGYDMRE